MPDEVRKIKNLSDLTDTCQIGYEQRYDCLFPLPHIPNDKKNWKDDLVVMVMFNAAKGCHPDFSRNNTRIDQITLCKSPSKNIVLTLTLKDCVLHKEEVIHTPNGFDLVHARIRFDDAKIKEFHYDEQHKL